MITTPVVSGQRLAAMRSASVWGEDEVRGLRAVDVGLLSVGGGLASLALVHLLRIAGVRVGDIRVVGPHESPVDSFRHLAHAGQLGDRDRLRSDSAARVDNVWGFPGYAVEEAWTRRSPGPLWKVFAEPVGAEVFTPVSGHVYHAAQTEARRLGWAQMAVRGQVQMIRPHQDGGFLSLLAEPREGVSVIRSRYVHLGLGHPGLRLTEELMRHRGEYGDGFSCVNAYEPHEHVYRSLARTGGSVVVRGSGITASRIIERLFDTGRESRAGIRVVHLTGPAAGTSGDGWNYQPFNFPKAALGGQLSQRIERVEDDCERRALIRSLGITSTARRRGWQRQLRAGRAEGCYQVMSGALLEVRPIGGHGVRLDVRVGRMPSMVTSLEADFLIDCTGLHPIATAHPVVSCLAKAGLVRTAEDSRLVVDKNFELREARNGVGRMYATGAATSGSWLGPVDSFWGLQAAALRVCDSLAAQGFGSRIGVRRSVCGWWRWLHGRAP